MSSKELVQFVEFVDAFKDEQDEDFSLENFMYQLIFKKQGQGSFPNVEIPHVFGAYGQQLQHGVFILKITHYSKVLFQSLLLPH